VFSSADDELAEEVCASARSYSTEKSPVKPITYKNTRNITHAKTEPIKRFFFGDCSAVACFVDLFEVRGMREVRYSGSSILPRSHYDKFIISCTNSGKCSCQKCPRSIKTRVFAVGSAACNRSNSEKYTTGSSLL
jgi:hypothetical protein